MISGWERLNPGVIIVVDNGSRDDDLAILRQAGNDFRLVLNDSNRGYAGENKDGDIPWHSRRDTPSLCC